MMDDVAGFFLYGDEGDRTPGLMNAIHALSQLSYAPICSMIFYKGEMSMKLYLFLMI